jgi:hypothetical protein
MQRHKVVLDNKTVFISQNGTDFRIIHPLRNEDGSWNWFNILTGGSWTNVIIVAVAVFIICGLLWEYSSNINLLKDCFRVPGMLDKCIEAYSDR